jgi:hypothetical protein
MDRPPPPPERPDPPASAPDAPPVRRARSFGMYRRAMLRSESEAAGAGQDDLRLKDFPGEGDLASREGPPAPGPADHGADAFEQPEQVVYAFEPEQVVYAFEPEKVAGAFEKEADAFEPEKVVVEPPPPAIRTPVPRRRGSQRPGLAVAAATLLLVPLVVLVLWGRSPVGMFRAGGTTEVGSTDTVEAADAQVPAVAASPGGRDTEADPGSGTDTLVRSPAADARPAEGSRSEPAANGQDAVTSGVRGPVTPGAAAPRPAEPPARPPVATEGRLVVLSEPEGAIVTVNGIGRGATPATVRFLPLGEFRVRVSLQGYRSEERVVRLGGAQPNATVRFTLRAWD